MNGRNMGEDKEEEEKEEDKVDEEEGRGGEKRNKATRGIDNKANQSTTF